MKRYGNDTRLVPITCNDMRQMRERGRVRVSVDTGSAPADDKAQRKRQRPPRALVEQRLDDELGL